MEGKKRKHVITDKVPVLLAIIYGIVVLVITQIAAFIPTYIVNAFSPVQVSFNPIFVIISAVVALLIFVLWYKPEFAGFIKTSEYKLNLWILLIAYALYLGTSFIQMAVEHSSFKVTLVAVCTAFGAGVLEEVAFRAYMIPIMMRKKKDIVAAILVSSIVFSLVHGANALFGADPLRTLLQVAATFFIGIALGAMYLMSGNILIPIAVHFIHDVIALSIQGIASEDGIVAGGLTLSSVLWDIPALIIGVFALIYVLKNKEDIIKLWEKKWTLE